jgi:16S rRNA (uracil1498-N3)-methyltransferase
MQSHEYDFRLPRLYVDHDLEMSGVLTLSVEQVHYLKTVMRRPDGTDLRLFNGRQGEWLGTISYQGKRDGAVTLQRRIRTTPIRKLKLHLVFALIKKDRMDFMVEKAVELGVTDLHPVITQNSVIRDLNTVRMERQILEAAEQCERLDLPLLHPLASLKDMIRIWPRNIPLLAALERQNSPFISVIEEIMPETGLLIGPEGGFGEDERRLLLDQPWVRPVSLGEQILRSETAALFGISVLSAAAGGSAG